MTTKAVFRDWLDRKLTEPGFRREWEKLQPGYQVARLRMELGLTQKQLAKKAGTTQSSIARLESGKKEPSLRFLRKIADALEADIKVELVERDRESPVVEDPVPELCMPSAVVGRVLWSAERPTPIIAATIQSTVETEDGLRMTIARHGVKSDMQECLSDADLVTVTEDDPIPVPNWPGAEISDSGIAWGGAS